MPTEIKIPELGENISAGDVVRVLVKAGDTIEKDQPVLELETDKATIEVPSTAAGTILEVKVKPGDKVKVGQVVLTLAEAPRRRARAESGAGEGRRRRSSEGRARRRRPVEERGSGCRRCTQAEAAACGSGGGGRAQPGSDVRAHQRRRGSGPRRRGSPRAGRTSSPARSRAARWSTSIAAPAPRRRRRRPAPRPTRRASRGPGGAAYAGWPASSAWISPSSRAAGRRPHHRGRRPGLRPRRAERRDRWRRRAARAPLPDFAKWGPVERKPLSNIRRKTAEQLGLPGPDPARHPARPRRHHRARRPAQALRAAGREGGRKLTVTAFALKAVAGALKDSRSSTASIDMRRNELITRSTTTSASPWTPTRGLLVPVDPRRGPEGRPRAGRGADRARGEGPRRKARRSTRCRAAPSPSPTSAASAAPAFTPIVNWPEVAILGLSRASGTGWRPPASKRRDRAAADAAAVALLRPPGDRRRRRGPLPPLDLRGSRAAFRAGALNTCNVQRAGCNVLKRAPCSVLVPRAVPRSADPRTSGPRTGGLAAS